MPSLYLVSELSNNGHNGFYFKMIIFTMPETFSGYGYYEMDELIPTTKIVVSDELVVRQQPPVDSPTFSGIDSDGPIVFEDVLEPYGSVTFTDH